jgi:PAS domain S-box-containing protein
MGQQMSVCEKSLTFMEDIRNHSGLEYPFYLSSFLKYSSDGCKQEHTICMEQFFQSLSRTKDGAFIIDGHQRIIFWNQSAEEILGYTAEEVVGRHCYEILGGRDEQGRNLCQRFCQMAIQAERGGVLPNQDVLARTQTGGERWLNMTTFVYPVRDETIAPVIVHLFRDATEKKNYQHFVNQILSASDRLQRNEIHQFDPVNPADSHIGKLTARERQVLETMAQGLGTDEMADTLAISPSTVRNHVQNILGKLGVHSRLEAIAYAYQHGLNKKQ